MLTFIRYIEVNFTFALTLWIVSVITIEDFVKARFVKSRFVKSSFCSINFTVILACLKKIVRYTKDFVMFPKSPFGEVKYVCMFHCKTKFLALQFLSSFFTLKFRFKTYGKPAVLPKEA